MNKHKEALLTKSINELRGLAAAFEPPILLAANDTRQRIVKKILDREDQEIAKSHTCFSPEAGAVSSPLRPDFEAAASQPQPEQVERRGGPRPGAGRPLGMTDEKAAARNLTPIPNVTIHKAIFLGGKAWAKSVEIPAVAFSEEETALLSLPLTHIHDTYFPNLIPEMGHVFVALAYGIHQLVLVRLTLIKEVQAQRKEANKDGKDGEVIPHKPEEKVYGQTGHTTADRQDGQRQDVQGPQAG